jgi:phosphoserine phosphatase
MARADMAVIAVEMVGMSKANRAGAGLVATFVAGRGAALSEAMVARALRDAALGASPLDWLAPDVAADVFFEAHDFCAARARLAAALAGEPVDVIAQPAAGRRKRLLVADMDSTMIEQECIDELAGLIGIRDRISAITERAMAGELNFETALKERVALLAGVTLDQIETIVSRITLTPGALALVRTMRAHGAHAALVTGGFTQFTQPVAARLGFDEIFANRLEITDRALTGVVIEPVQGREGKRAALVDLRERLGLAREATLAIGDGANDLDMLQEAGLGVAYHAKPKVAEAAHARVDHADLTTLLYAQGYRREEFAA